MFSYHNFDITASCIRYLIPFLFQCVRLETCYHYWMILTLVQNIAYRWSEVFISILKREGYSIEYPDDWDGNDAQILVNGKTELWEFLNNMQESKYQLLKNHPFLITRHFDARVKSLIKNVLMGPGSGKIKISEYSYRVEFQARGMPHIYTWCCLDQ